MNEIRLNDSEMSIRLINEALSIPGIALDCLGEYRLKRKRTVKEMRF